MARYFPGVDLVRVCACFLVVELHVAATQFGSFFAGWKLAAAWDAAARMSVPLFFMLTGFLLMDGRTESLARFYLRRYLRILLPFALVCLLYYFTPRYAGFSPGHYLWYIAGHYVDYHLWYVYALVGIYLALPFFQRMVSAVDGLKLAWLYVAIWFVAFVIAPLLFDGNPLAPEVAAFQRANPGLAFAESIGELFRSPFVSWDLIFFYGFMGYVLLGWLLRRHFELLLLAPVRLGGLVLCVFATLAMIWLTWRDSLCSGAPDQKWFMNISLFVVLQALGFFVLCIGRERGNALLASLADKAYWIYLIHLILLRFFCGLWQLPQSRLTGLAIPACAALIFVTAYFAAIPLRAAELWLLRRLRIY